MFIYGDGNIINCAAVQALRVSLYDRNGDICYTPLFPTEPVKIIHGEKDGEVPTLATVEISYGCNYSFKMLYELNNIYTLNQFDIQDIVMETVVRRIRYTSASSANEIFNDAYDECIKAHNENLKKQQEENNHGSNQ